MGPQWREFRGGAYMGVYIWNVPSGDPGIGMVGGGGGRLPPSLCAAPPPPLPSSLAPCRALPGLGWGGGGPCPSTLEGAGRRALGLAGCCPCSGGSGAQLRTRTRTRPGAEDQAQRGSPSSRITDRISGRILGGQGAAHGSPPTPSQHSPNIATALTRAIPAPCVTPVRFLPLWLPRGLSKCR